MMAKRFVKVLSGMLAALVLLTQLAGCGASKGAGSTVAPSASPAGTTTVSAAPEKKPLEEVTLRIYFPGEKKSATDEVWQTVSEQLKDKLNVKFDINFIAFNDYPDKLTVMATSGDTYDMNFDGNWLAYPKMVNKGAYLELNELLPQYAPNTYASLEKAGALEAAKVNGKIMAIPWEMKMNQQKTFLRWRKDVAEKYGMSYAKDSIKTVEDLDKFLTEAQSKIPKDMITFSWDAGDMSNLQGTLLTRDNMATLDFHTFVFDINDPKCTVIPVEQTKAYKDAADLTKKWVDAGIIQKNLMVDKEQSSAQYRNGKLFASITSHEWANADQGFADPAWTNESSALYPDVKSINRSSLANVTCINKNAANPERALMFLDLLTTDQQLYDLVLYGIKDKTYVLDGEIANFPEGMTAANSSYIDWAGQWAWWKPQFMRPTVTYPKGFWENEAEFASQSTNIANPLDGLFFSTDAIKNEIAKRDQVLTEHGKLIQYGLIKSDVETAVNDYIAKQKEAGLDKMLADLQKQVDDYLANK